MTLPLGAAAVDFSLPSTDGEVSLESLRGQPFLLCFYAMAFTPV